MKHQKLFRHPVGVFSFTARWYLASLAVLSLILVAVHFVIHIQAQEQAQQLMQQWLGKAHIDVEQVRYHLLRNALTLKNIRVQRGQDLLEIGQILIRADAKSLTGGSKKLGNLEISGVKAIVRDFSDSASWRHDGELLRIWGGAEGMHLDNASLVLYAGGNEAPPLEFDAINLKQWKMNDILKMQISAELYGAPVRIETHSTIQSPGLQRFLRGWRIAWHDVEADAVMASMGWGTLTGSSDGELEFQTVLEDRSGNGPDGLKVDGHISVMSNEDGLSHKLTLHGDRHLKLWKISAQAEHWPLAPWAEYLPPILGKQVVAGQWQGDVALEQRSEHWLGGSRKGELQDVHLMCGQADSADCRLEKLHYQGLVWNGAMHTIGLDSLALNHLNLAIPAVAEQREELNDNWKLGAKKITLQNAGLSIETEQGSLSLAALQGDGSLTDAGLLEFDLESMPQDSSESSVVLPHWALKGQLKGQGAQWESGSAALNGSAIPLQQLRAVVPLTGSSDWPVRMEGDASVYIKASVDRGSWTFNGDMTANNVAISHTGDKWFAKKVQVDFGPLGAALERQVIRRLDVKDWQYTAALHPLGSFKIEDENKAEVSAPFWWAKLLHDNNWTIQAFDAVNGNISVGRNDAQWATGLVFSGQRLAKSGWSEFTCHGLVDGGEMNVNGSWIPFAQVPEYRLNMKLQSANVFFLRDWLQASSLPGLIRGRLSVNLDVHDGKSAGDYFMRTSISLSRAKTEDTPSPHDPLVDQFGYGLSDVITKLDDGKGKAFVAFDLPGSWRQSPPSMGRWRAALGQSVQGRLKQESLILKKPKSNLYEARVRIHQSGHLSHNERVRLRRLWRHLRANKKWVVDMEPTWGGNELDAEVISRIRYTQGLVEAFMHERGIATGRIYPQWPLQKDKAKDLGAIHVIVRTAN